MWLFWVVTSVLAGGIILAFPLMTTLRRSAPGTMDATDGLPLTKLQRESWAGLAIGVVVTGLLAGLVSANGLGSFESDAKSRFAVYALLAVGAIPALRLALLARRDDPSAVDERDREVLARTPRIQLAGLFAVLVAWTVALTEIYWDAGQIPLAYLALILWSCLLVVLVSLPLGILLGYREVR